MLYDYAKQKKRARDGCLMKLSAEFTDQWVPGPFVRLRLCTIVIKIIHLLGLDTAKDANLHVVKTIRLTF